MAPKRRNSGQVLIVTSLIVVMLLLSTVLYVRETQKATLISSQDHSSEIMVAIKQASVHTTISALANVTNGGSYNILQENLDAFASAMQNNLNGMTKIKFEPITSIPYSNGFWVSTETNGSGVSSASVRFTLNYSGISSSLYSDFLTNITTAVTVNGFFIEQNESFRQVSLTCSLTNEGQAAPARNFTVNYMQNSWQWVQATIQNISDVGSSYVIQFNAENTNPDMIPISISCQDKRGITVSANATCNPYQ